MEYHTVLLAFLSLAAASCSAKAIPNPPFRRRPEFWDISNMEPHTFEPQRFGARSISPTSYNNHRAFDDFLAGTEDHQYQFWCMRNPHLCQRRSLTQQYHSHHHPNVKGDFSHNSLNAPLVPSSSSDFQEVLPQKTNTEVETTTESTTVSSTESSSVTTAEQFDSKEVEVKTTTKRHHSNEGFGSMPPTVEPEFGSVKSLVTASTVAPTPFQQALSSLSKDGDIFNFGTIPVDTPISSGDVKGFPASLTSSGVPVNPALTVLQELETPKVETSSEETIQEDDELDEEGFTVDDPDDFLSNIRFRPVKFRPFQVLEIFDHPIQAYPRLAKPVRADSILSLLNNNFADVLRELQEREMTQR